MVRQVRFSMLLAAVAVACAEPTRAPQIALDGTYNSTGPVEREGNLYVRASFIFSPAGYWNETDFRSEDAAFYSNGTYEFDGTTLVLRSTLSWQAVRSGTVHNDSISLNDASALTLVR